MVNDPQISITVRHLQQRRDQINTAIDVLEGLHPTESNERRSNLHIVSGRRKHHTLSPAAKRKLQYSTRQRWIQARKEGRNSLAA